ncbi:MAG: PA0069 family radical SAM protein [Rhodospirillaceae bacterium]|nr:PA0069 family radical SAM protein [Rhodospirillaceae bacterium]MBT5373201.1 PA0069 family radical SAM protein [Rhodospirillaceae bacterium]MBT5751369.1 PA0069 family radical SAM protein [Rhodospirillaceae bacterium]
MQEEPTHHFSDDPVFGDQLFGNDQLPDRPFKGRGVAGNLEGRFETLTRHKLDDGWQAEYAEGEYANEERAETALPSPQTEIYRDASRTILARNNSPDLPFDRSINPYRGCEHGCTYCYARPSHAYLGLSPGLDFETRLFAKPDAPALLEAALRRPGYKPAVIALGSNTDPYQPIERGLNITREILEVLEDFSHPVTIVTKSALVLRDLDILGPMAERGLASVAISITTLDKTLASRMEPRASAPARRLDAIAKLAEAGIPTAVFSAPMIPALNDHELENILKIAAQAGASSAAYTLLRMPLEVEPLFTQWLETNYPDRAGRVLNLIRQCREGELNDSTFGQRMKGSGPIADLLSKRFSAACRRFSLEGAEIRLDPNQFCPPLTKGDQMALF